MISPDKPGLKYGDSLCILRNRVLASLTLSQDANHIIGNAILRQHHKGLAKYSAALTAATPGDMLWHALEEAVDQAGYLTAHEPRVSGFWRRMKVRRARRAAERQLRRLAELVAERDERGGA